MIMFDTKTSQMPEDIEPYIRALDFSAEEWLTILSAWAGAPSERRNHFAEPIELQVRQLPQVIADAALEDTGIIGPAARVEALAWPFRLAVLEVIERFWSVSRAPASFEKSLAAVGVRLVKSAHERMEAHRLRNIACG